MKALVAFLALSSGCAAHRTETLPAASAAFAADASEEKPDFQEGLTKVLSMASADDAQLITLTYKLGFHVGEAEGAGVAARRRGENEEMGCRAAFIVLLPRDLIPPGGASICEGFRRGSGDEEHEGPRYIRSRLTVTQKAVELGYPVPKAQSAYDNGYDFGFRSEYKLDSRIMGELANGCKGTVQAAVDARDVEPALVDEMNAYCDAQGAEYLEKLNAVRAASAGS